MAKLRHDLSNPLSAILAETQLLLLAPEKYDEETLAGLKQIEDLGAQDASDAAKPRVSKRHRLGFAPPRRGGHRAGCALPFLIRGSLAACAYR